MHVHRARLARVVIAPHAAQQLLAAHGHVAAPGEHRQQVKFQRRQRHVLAVQLHAPRGKVDHQLPALKRLLLTPGAPQDVLHARQQLRRLKRLEDVVLRAHRQAPHAVRHAGLRRHEQHRHIHLNQRLSQRKAVLARQHHVQQRQVRHFFCDHHARRRGVLRLAHSMPDQRQVHGQNLADRRLILHNQNIGQTYPLPFPISIPYRARIPCNKVVKTRRLWYTVTTVEKRRFP